jgi:hypothetical protein
MRKKRFVLSQWGKAMEKENNKYKMSISFEPKYIGLFFLLGIILLVTDSVMGWGLTWYYLAIPFLIPFTAILLGVLICLILSVIIFLMTCISIAFGALEDCIVRRI